MQDNPEILAFFKDIWGEFENQKIEMKELVETVLAKKQLWGTDLTSIPNLVSHVTSNLLQIAQKGVKEALKEINETSIIE